MPRLREPPAAKKNEPFDSTKIPPPVEEDPKEPQLEAIADDEPEIVVEEPKKEGPKQDDAALALKKQVDALRESEKLLKRQHEDALKAVTEQKEKIVKSQRDILDAQEIALDKTRKAAKADSEKALLDYKNARDSGDTNAEAEALDRLTDAKANMRAFERDIEELKIRKKELKKERRSLKEQQEQAPSQTQPHTVDEIVDSWNLPHEETQWAKDHPEYVTDRGKSEQLAAANMIARRKGYAPGDPKYLQEIERVLDIGVASPVREQQDTSRKTSILSAPVSREVPSTGSGQRQSGRVTLTRDQIEAAKIAGVSPAEYARQLVKLNEMKANGEYGERR